MNEDNIELMLRYGITDVTKMIYCYKHYKYNNLADAVRYAMHDNNKLGGRSSASVSSKIECSENKVLNA